MKVDEGPLCDAVRLTGECYELSIIPPEASMKYYEISNSKAEYPIPEINKPVVLIGRGFSADGFQERYPRDKYIRVGLNPGSIPASPDPTAGRFGDCANDFDAIVSADQLYLSTCGHYVMAYYEGPVLVPDVSVNGVKIHGSYHGITRFCRRHYGHTPKLAVEVFMNLAAKDIILCGQDYEGDMEKLRAPMDLFIEERAKEGRCKFWLDEKAIFTGCKVGTLAPFWVDRDIVNET